MQKRNFFGLLVLVALIFGFRSNPLANLDLSTPEASFGSLVDVLKSGEVEQLQYVATPTGLNSLIYMYTQEDYQDGMSVLANELEASNVLLDSITDEIYLISARFDEATVHKMEFTKETPGWMLYHWQLTRKQSEN